MHGFHLIVIGSDYNKLKKTISYATHQLPKFRSINIGNTSNGKILDLDNIITRQIHISDKSAESIKLLFEHLITLKILKLFILFEGEIIINNYGHMTWDKSKDNILIKTYFENTEINHWSPRIIHLKEKWIINDIYYPKLMDKKGKVSILDVPIYISNSQIRPPITLINKYFNKSIYNLKIGEINIAKKLFIETKNSTFNNSIKSICYFGIGKDFGIENQGNFSIIRELCRLMKKWKNHLLCEPIFITIISNRLG